MAKKRFDDPLEDIDPIMEEAFSFGTEGPVSGSAKEEKHSRRPSYEEDDRDNATVSEIQFPNLSRDEVGRKFESDIFNNI